MIEDQERVLEGIKALKTEENSWLEVATQWLEENSVPESLYIKTIPESIVELIKEEAKAERLLRPSVIATDNSTTLDFLYD